MQQLQRQQLTQEGNVGAKLGIAIIGCGYWGVNHVRVFSELPETDVVMVCDQLPERIAEIGRRFPGVPASTSLDDVLANPDVDAVVVCTGATTHFEVTRRCLEADKHVLVEKPITTSSAEADILIDLAEHRKRLLMVGHTFLYNPAIHLVQDYIREARIGQVYYLYAQRTNLGPIRRDVNALWDLAPHDISIFNFLLGSSPEWASAVGVKALRNCREDVGFVALGYPNGIVGHIHVSWADPNKVRQIVVVGSQERIVFDDVNSAERVRVFEKGVTPVVEEPTSFGEYQLLMRDGDIISPRIEVSEPLKNECRHFIQCLLDGSRPLTGAREGQEVVEVMEAIDRSIELQGAPVMVKERQYAVGA
jgi:predicted dehydrogenase